MKSISFSMLSTVLETWDLVHQSKPNAEHEFGQVALERLFRMQPKAMKIFSSGDGSKADKAQVALHAKAFWNLFESIFLLIGTDQEYVEEILKLVGERHRSMGVKASFFPYMGEAVIATVEELLGKKLTIEQKEAWDEVYDSISNEIVKNLLVAN